MDYGADEVDIYDDVECKDAEHLRKLIDEGEIDIIESCCFISNVNELYVNGEEVKGRKWQEEFGEVEVPQKGLYALGGWCRGRSYLTLELPDEEKFDASKLVISGLTSMEYHLDDHVIAATWEDDAWGKGETGSEFYYNGTMIE